MGFDHAVRFEQIALKKGGSTLSLDIQAGSSVAIVGRAGAGKSRLLACIAGDEKLASGAVRLSPDLVVCDQPSLPKKGKLGKFLSRGRRDLTEEQVALLGKLGIPALRQRELDRLTPSEANAIGLVAGLESGRDVVLIDGLLDGLDMASRAFALERMIDLRAGGTIYLIATHAIDVIETCDAVIVLKDSEFGFSGSMAHLRDRMVPTEFVLETTRASSVRSMIDPLTVKVEEDGDTLRLETFEGQEVAQRLLIEGYGDVRYVVIQRPNLADLIRSLL